MKRRKKPHPGFVFGKSAIENLRAMSVQRDFEEVKAECEGAFSEEFGDADPLRAAIDHAKAYDIKCLVVQDDWFMIVPGFKTDMVGWLNCLKIWESIEQQKRIAKARK